MAKSRALSPHQQRLLAKAVYALDDANVHFAIGGAVAMHAHGLRRETADVDAFVREEDRGIALRALRQAGFEVFPIASPFHYTAHLPEFQDPDERVDILVPAGDPELSAIEVPDDAEIGDVPVPVFPIDLLVATKFYANRPKDELDISEMLDRGLFDPEGVAEMLAHLSRQDAEDFRALIKQIELRRRQQRPRKPGRLPSRKK